MKPALPIFQKNHVYIGQRFGYLVTKCVCISTKPEVVLKPDGCDGAFALFAWDWVMDIPENQDLSGFKQTPVAATTKISPTLSPQAAWPFPSVINDKPVPVKKPAAVKVPKWDVAKPGKDLIAVDPRTVPYKQGECYWVSYAKDGKLEQLYCHQPSTESNSVGWKDSHKAGIKKAGQVSGFTWAYANDFYKVHLTPKQYEEYKKYHGLNQKPKQKSVTLNPAAAWPWPFDAN